MTTPGVAGGRVKAGIGALLLVVAAAWICGCCDDKSDKSGYTLLLEYDYIAGSNAPVTEVQGPSETRSLADEFSDASIEVVPDVAAVTWSLPSGMKCWDTDELESLIPATENLAPQDSETWYSHGVVLPCCTGIQNGVKFEYPGYEERKAFVVCEKKESTPYDILSITIHELNHVLNLHEGEFEYLGTPTQVVKNHLGNHQDKGGGDFELGYHVRPGGLEVTPVGDQLEFDSTRELWQDYESECSVHNCALPNPAVHYDWGPTKCSSFTWWSSPWTLSPTGPSGPSLTLALEDEQPKGRPNIVDGQYIVGEPFRVTATLSAEPQSSAEGVQYLGEESFDPDFAFLRFRANDDAAGRRSLFAEKDWDEESLAPEGSVVVKRRDAWFYMRDPPPIEQTLRVHGSYSGIVGLKRPVRGETSVILSVPDNELFDERAYEIFTRPKARLFMLRMNGTESERGMESMEKIVEDHPRTIYAPYANLALGKAWSEPFKYFDKERKAIVLRPRDPGKVEAYLQAAEAMRKLLPTSFQEQLDEAKAALSD